MREGPRQTWNPPASTDRFCMTRTNAGTYLVLRLNVGGWSALLVDGDGTVAKLTARPVAWSSAYGAVLRHIRGEK